MNYIYRLIVNPVQGQKANIEQSTLSDNKLVQEQYKRGLSFHIGSNNLCLDVRELNLIESQR